MIKDLAAIAAGTAFIVMGFAIKKFYYSKSLHGALLSDKVAPTWLGRALFLLIGLGMVAIGVRDLLRAP